MVFAVKEQKIRIGVEYFVKNAQKARESVKQFNAGVFRQNMETQRLTSAQKFANTQIERFKTSNLKFGQVMKMNHKRLGDFNQSGYKFNTLGGRMANRLRMMSHGMRGFKMEMLGVMFFGMALARTMTGLLRTSLEWVGINEILAATLGMLFLPVALELLPWALKFMDYILNLDESTKLWIGRIVVATAAIGGFLFIVGQTMLGIGSIIMAFGGLGFWLFILPGLLALIAIGYLLFRDKLTKLNKPLDDVNDKLVGLGFIAPDSFSKVKEAAQNLWSFLKDKFVNVWDNIIEKLPGIISKAREMFFKFVEFIPTIIPFMIEGGGRIIASLATGIVENIDAIANAINQTVNFLIGFISDNIDMLLSGGKKILQAILDGISDNTDLIGEVIEKIIDMLVNFINENIIKIVGVGVDIGLALLKGIGKAFKENAEIIGLALGSVIGLFFGGPLGAAIGGAIGGTVGMGIKSFQTGGVVPGQLGTATPIMAHAGERVVPVGGMGRTQTGTTNNSLAPNITINVASASESDIFTLTDEINRRMGTDFERLTKSRATF